MYKNFIIEGADQQGKTTLINKFIKKGFNSFGFGKPSENFDFYNDYIKPFKNGVNIYDRSFISEIVYSEVLNREVRVKEFNKLVNFFKNNNFVFLFLERKNYKWINRDELFNEGLNELFLKKYREVFERIDCEKYFLDPENKNDILFIEKLINGK